MAEKIHDAQEESGSASVPSAGAGAPDLDGITIRCARSIAERILHLAFKHEVQTWLDAPGTDSQKLGRIVGEARDLIELLDTARGSK